MARALAAPLGQGGRIVAAYANAAGQSAGEDLLWQNPTNFNGTVPVQQTFTANAGALTLRLALTAVLDAGHLDFGDFALQRLAAGDVIRRSTYMLAGTAVAVRVTGDPDGNDGLHYLYSDHLGSASAMQKDDGSAPIITRYTPFGGYRAGSGTNTVTDRGFTGQPENMDLGLYYYQARFYVPGIGRFASADTLVPDPTNPQSFNRYSYVFNRPTHYADPSGHCPWCLITGAIGGAFTGGTYLITTPMSEWKASELVLTTSVGVAGGALIGTGVGAPAGSTMILAAAGTGVVVASGSYLLDNARNDASFDSIDFTLAGIAGGVDGAFSAVPGVGPLASSTFSGVVAGGESALSDIFHGNQIDWADASSSAGKGVVAGLVGSAITGQFSGEYFKNARLAEYGIGGGEAKFVDLMTPAIQNPYFISKEPLFRTAIRDFVYGYGIDLGIDILFPFSQSTTSTP